MFREGRVFGSAVYARFFAAGTIPSLGDCHHHTPPRLGYVCFLVSSLSFEPTRTLKLSLLGKKTGWEPRAPGTNGHQGREPTGTRGGNQREAMVGRVSSFRVDETGLDDSKFEL